MKKKEYENAIEKVEEKSIAEEVGIEKGDILISINGKKVNDIIDYLFLSSDNYLELEIKKKNNELWIYEIEKDFDEDLGIVFCNPILDKANHCKNKCIFCFIDQLPPNMRETLYFKDDDSRLSFLQGNFITLTNLTDEDINRIIEYNISPINVSIHTTNPDLRIKMLNNKSAGNILKRLKYLTDNRIVVNGQIVLCPGINDGSELNNTLKDLIPMYPNLHSVAVVPVGITKYRDKLYPLEGYDKIKAEQVIRQIEKWQEHFKKKIDTNFVYLSDEFYIIAQRELPSYGNYEDFPQIENGVGLLRKFEHEFNTYLNSIPDNLTVDKTYNIITGVAAEEFLKKLINKLTNKISKLKITVHSVKNHFFGDKITVSGLITGQDIIQELRGKKLGEGIFIPKSMLKADKPVFLDGITVNDIEKELNVPVIICDVNGKSLIQKIIK